MPLMSGSFILLVDCLFDACGGLDDFLLDLGHTGGDRGGDLLADTAEVEGERRRHRAALH